MVHTHTHTYTHTQPVLLGNLQFAFESDHPLWFSAAVHVKTALNSSRNCWHTSVDVSSSTPYTVPRVRSKVLPPSPPLGATREKPVALRTSHSLPLATLPRDSYVNVTPCHMSPHPACCTRQRSALHYETLVHFMMFNFENTL